MKASFKVLVLTLAALVGLVATASAQDGDGPAIELDPETVEEAGTYDVTVRGSGFTIDVFVLQCPGAAGDVEALTEGDPTTLCDIGNLQTGSPDDEGGWEVIFEQVEVTDCGLVFVAADIDQTEVGGPIALEVENPAEDAVCEVTATEGYDEETVGTGEEGAAGEEELAATGLNTWMMVLVGSAVLLGGWFISMQARQFRRSMPR